MVDEAKELRKVMVPCSSCVKRTSHDVLFETSQQDDHTLDTYALLECRGCFNISMGHRRIWTSEGRGENFIYPSPVSRKEPEWLSWLEMGVHGEKEKSVGALLKEVYRAVDGAQNRLAAMGIRAALEQVMIIKVGDLRTFDDKLDAFQDAGYISSIQRDSMRATLDVGDAAMHRAYAPSQQDLMVALQVVEGVLAPLYGHRDLVQSMADRVPPRQPKPKA
jgi:hypothetical protein